jgi:hypothetical protein
MERENVMVTEKYLVERSHALCLSDLAHRVPYAAVHLSRACQSTEDCQIR